MNTTITHERNTTLDELEGAFAKLDTLLGTLRRLHTRELQLETTAGSQHPYLQALWDANRSLFDLQERLEQAETARTAHHIGDHVLPESAPPVNGA